MAKKQNRTSDLILNSRCALILIKYLPTVTTQIDFKTKMLCNIEKGIIKRQFAFSKVKSCDDGTGSRFTISFKGHHDYELEATSLEDKHKVNLFHRASNPQHLETHVKCIHAHRDCRVVYIPIIYADKTMKDVVLVFLCGHLLLMLFNADVSFCSAQIIQLVNQIIYGNIYSDPGEGNADLTLQQPQASQSLREGVLLLHRGGLASFRWVKYGCVFVM